MENKKQANLSDVVRAFWVGAKDYKHVGLYTVLGFVFATIVDLLIPLQYKKFFDLMTGAPQSQAVAQALFGIILTVLILNIVRWFFFRTSNFAVNYFEARVMARLREIAFNYTIDHSYSFFSNNFSGAIVQKIGRFVRSFEKLFDNFIYNFMPLITALVMILIVVSLQNIKLALILLFWVLITVTVSYFFSKWKLKYDTESAASDSKATAYLADVIANQNTVSSFAAGEFESKGFKQKVMDQAKAVLLTWNLGEVMNLIQSAFILIIEFLLFYFGIKFWQEGLITVGTFVLIQVYVLNLSQRLWNFSSVVRNVYEGVGDAKEMVDILKTPHEVSDIPDAKTLNISDGEINFQNVSFAFNESRKVLNGINISIKKGEKVALIGPSGAGKSTIVKLLLRMYNLVDGQISIDGQDIQKVTQESLREHVSLVPQDPILFHRSLRENIKYGKQDATDEEVVEASKLAHCDEFID